MLIEQSDGCNHRDKLYANGYIKPILKEVGLVHVFVLYVAICLFFIEKHMLQWLTIAQE